MIGISFAVNAVGRQPSAIKPNAKAPYKGINLFKKMHAIISSLPVKSYGSFKMFFKGQAFLVALKDILTTDALRGIVNGFLIGI